MSIVEAAHRGDEVIVGALHAEADSIESHLFHGREVRQVERSWIHFDRHLRGVVVVPFQSNRGVL